MTVKLTYPIRILLETTYFTGISPFRVGFNENGKAVVVSWLPQKITCGILTIVAVLPHITHAMWFSTRKKADWSPPLYFRFLTLLFRFAWYSFFYFNLWFHPNKFIDIVKFIEETKFLPQISIRPLDFYCFTWGSIILYGIGGILEIFGMLNNFDTSKPNQFVDFHNSPTYWLVFQLIVFSHGSIAGFYIQLFQLFCVVTLWIPSKSFAKMLQRKNLLFFAGTGRVNKIFYTTAKRLSEEDDSKWINIRNQHLALKELSSLINDVISEMMFFYTTYALSNYSYLFDSVFLTKMETDRLRLLIRYMNVALTYFLAADICKQIEMLKEWMGFDARKIKVVSQGRHHRIRIISHEICKNPTIAIRGWKAFTVTYNFVAQISGAIITYFIICIQFRS